MIRSSSAALLVAIGILFLPRDLQAQNQKKGIHIKERVTISPLAPRAAQSAAADTAAHSIRAVLSASPPTALRLVVTRESCPGDSELISQKNYDGTGSVTFEISDTKPRVYEFFGQLSPGVTATFSLYTDDSLAYEYQEANPSNPWYPAPFEDFIHAYGEFLPFATDLQLRFLQTCLQSPTGSGQAGATTTVAVPPVYSCSAPIRWSPERDLIHFQVLAGETLGEFRTSGGTPLGSDFQLKYADAQNMRFVANSGLDHGGVVILEASVSGLVKTAITNVYTPNDLAFAFGGIQDVKFGQEHEFFVETRVCDGLQKSPGAGVTYTAAIVEGNQYGTLYSYDTDGKGDTLTGLPQFNGRAYITFTAWEGSPVDSEKIVVEVTSSDGSVEPATVEFYVLPVGCLTYQITPPTIAPGDTAAILFKEEMPNGTLNDYPPDQLFDVSIAGGTGTGTLLFEGDTASVWEAIPQGISFIADTTFIGDSAFALIKAKLSEGGTSVSAAPVGRAGLLQGDSAHTVNGPTSKVQMAALKMESAVAQRVNALAEACQLSGVVVITANEPQLLVVVLPNDLTISAAPKMPEFGILSQLKNYSGGKVSFYWDLTVKWKGPNGRETKGVYTGQEVGANSDPVTLPVDWEGVIRGGDDLTLHVLAIAGTRTYEENIEGPFRIIGENPSKQTIKAELTLEEQVLAYLESRFRQFNNKRFPLWGSPDGWGIMQVDTPSNDNQLWDWKKNVAEGKRRFEKEKVQLARTYADRVRKGTTWKPIRKNGKWKKEFADPVKSSWYQSPYPKAEDLSEDEVIYEMFQRYNGGVYFRWDPDVPGDPESNGAWLLRFPLTDSIHYGNTAHAVYTIVQKVLKGELPPNYLPPGWN